MEKGFPIRALLLRYNVTYMRTVNEKKKDKFLSKSFIILYKYHHKTHRIYIEEEQRRDIHVKKKL